MKTYAILFSWVLVFLAYYPNGPITEAPLFWTLLLIGVAVDMLCFIARHAAECSEWEIDHKYECEMRRAFLAGEASRFVDAVKARHLFAERGES